MNDMWSVLYFAICVGILVIAAIALHERGIL